MSAKNLDSAKSGARLLPLCLIEQWADEKLPSWVSDWVGLPADASVRDLRACGGRHPKTRLPKRMQRYLERMVNSRRREVRRLKVFIEKWPAGVDVSRLELSVRTTNCLRKATVPLEPRTLSEITFDDLFSIPSMGAVSILEFACLAEHEIEKIRRISEPSGALSDPMEEVLELADQPWADQVGGEDPRFEGVLPKLGCSLFAWIDEYTSKPGDSIEAAINIHEIGQNKKRLYRLVEHFTASTLEDNLNELLIAFSGFRDARLEGMRSRLGWGGRPVATLEEVGKRLGITRERVRQLQQRITDRITAVPFQLLVPPLDSALEELLASCPIAPSKAALLFKQKGIAGGKFDVYSLLEIAKLLRRRPGVQLQTIRGRTLIVSAGVPFADRIVRTAYSQTGASGASNIDEVVSELAQKGKSISRKEVTTALLEFSDVKFVDEKWFIYLRDNPQRDRLRNVCRKMLSVAEPIPVSVMREGIRREYRYRGSRGEQTWPLLVPPIYVLRAYFFEHSEFMVREDGAISSAETLDYDNVLSHNEKIFVDVIRKTPASVIDRASFIEECLKRNMNIYTLNTYMSYSSILTRLAPEVWSLRGIHVDPAAIEAVRSLNALRPKVKRVVDHGWTPEGRLWIASRVPSVLASFVVTAPSSISKYLSGRSFEGVDQAGFQHGLIRINDQGVCYGYVQFLSQKGADEGDIFIIEFDLVNNKASLRMEDEEIIEEIDPLV